MRAESVRQLRQAIVAAATRHGAGNVRLFGSAARDDATADSDVDLLVDLDPGRSLLDVGALALDLEDLLGTRVHVVTEPSLHWFIRDRVLAEAVAL